jgi:cytoskeletal protein CcmA (bactofilin family)
MPETNAQQELATIIGPDVHLKGTLTFEKAVRLHGRFEGTVTTGGRLHVAREGKLEGEVEAAAIVIEGSVRGNLAAADRIELKPTAHYEGDLRAAKLVVEAGAVLTGHVSVGPDVVKNRPPQVQLVRPVLASVKAPEPQAVR